MLAAAVAAAFSAFAANCEEWPVARHFDGDHLMRVAMPMGGIGCGSVSLSGRGELVDWEIMNRANKTMSEAERGPVSRTFFAIRVKGAERLADGTVNPNARFPDMKGLADYVHAKVFSIRRSTPAKSSSCRTISATGRPKPPLRSRKQAAKCSSMPRSNSRLRELGHVADK